MQEINSIKSIQVQQHSVMTARLNENHSQLSVQETKYSHKSITYEWNA